MRTKEHNNKISLAIRNYYKHESDEQREKRQKSIREKRKLRCEIYKKIDEILDIYKKLEK